MPGKGEKPTPEMIAAAEAEAAKAKAKREIKEKEAADTEGKNPFAEADDEDIEAVFKDLDALNE